MAAQSKVAPKTSDANENELMDHVKAIEILAVTYQSYVESVSTVNEELLKFVNSRLIRDIELSRALSECADMSDATKLQREWAQQAMQEYLIQAQTLAKLTSKLADEMTARLEANK